jgi:hypothetical protein
MICPSYNKMRPNEQQLLQLDQKNIYFSHPKECNLYLSCSKMGNLTTLECAEGTHFSPYYQSCVHPSIANCKKFTLMDESKLIVGRLVRRKHFHRQNSQLFINNKHSILKN